MDTATAPQELRDLLQQAQQILGELADAASRMEELPAPELAEAVHAAATVGRFADVLMMRTVHAVHEQDRLAPMGESLAAQLGMRNAATVLSTLTGASRRTLQRWRQVDAATSARGFGSTGVLPPLFPHLAQALQAGAVSLDQALVIRQHLHQTGGRAHPNDLEAAEVALLAAATGTPDPTCPHGSDDAGADLDSAALDGEGGICGCEAGPKLPLTTELLAVQARVWRDAIDPDGPEPAYEQLRQQRSFTLGQRTDGMWVGRLLLPPDQGEALRLALDAHNAPRTNNRHGDSSISESSISKAAADALASAVTKSGNGAAVTEDIPTAASDAARAATGEGSGSPANVTAGDGASHAADSTAGGGAAGSTAGTTSSSHGETSGADGSAVPGGGLDAWDLEAAQRGSGLNRRNGRDDRTTAQRQADTLLTLITSAISDSSAPQIGGEPATLVVTISQEELNQHAETSGGTAHLERTGEPIPAYLAARILCDGYLQAAVLDDAGLPLKLGRSRRSHTKHQRRALLTAYPGGCQNPGCESPANFTEIHHPVWWSEGGDTDTDNGIPVCPHCHAEIHAGRLRCQRAPDGRWEIVPALGFPIRFPRAS